MRVLALTLLILATLMPTGAQSESTEAVGHLGVVIPVQSVDMAAEVAGTVRSISVALGDTVAAGQGLMEIAVPGLERQIAQAQASVQGARSIASQAAIELEDIERQLERRKQADEVFSAEELEAIDLKRRIKRAELDQANASTKERQAELALFRERLDASSIQAPYDGVVALLQCTEGSYAQAGESLLRLIGLEPPIIRFAVPAGDSAWLTAGATLDVRLDGAQESGKSIGAVVERVSPEIDPATDMLFAEARFDQQAQEGLDGLLIATGAVVRVWPR